MLAERKDTHVAKRFGNEVATEINTKAKSIIKQGGIFTVQGKQMINELDSYLRTSHARVINPGSTADLTATTIFLALLQGYRP